jgi:hypothetical protein
VIFRALGIEEGKIHNSAPRIDSLNRKTRYDVRILRACNLIALDWNTSDPYVVFSHPHLQSMEQIKTRVIVKNCNPSWNQDFTFYFPDDLEDAEAFLSLTVKDYDMVGTHEPCGRASMFLRDRTFNDLLSHDIPLELDIQGTLHVRVRKVGEIDDVGWWVQKVKQTLQFTADDMVRVILDQIIRVSRSMITKAIEHFRATVCKNSVAIRADVERALLPLLEYLDFNLGILNEHCDITLTTYLSDRYSALAAPIRKLHRSHMTASTSLDLIEIATMKRGRKEDASPSPNAIAKLVWSELLLLVRNIIASYGSSSLSEGLTKAETRRRRNEQRAKATKIASTVPLFPSTFLSDNEGNCRLVLDAAVELLKALFYCEVNGEKQGFSFKELKLKLKS